MESLESGSLSEFEIITITERVARDPRGISRVTLLGNDLVRVRRVKDSHPEDQSQDIPEATQDVTTTLGEE